MRILAPRRLQTLSALARYALAVGLAAGATSVRLALALAHGLGAVTPYNGIAILAATTATIALGIGPGLVTLGATDVVTEAIVLRSPSTLLQPEDLTSLGMLFLLGAFVCGIAHALRLAANRFRESEARLAAFADATFEGIVESEGGRIRDCNERLSQMLGWTVEELRGRPVSDVVAPEDLERVLENISQNRESVIEHGVVRADGTRIVVEAHGRPSASERGRRITALRDITSRKEAEHRLRTSEQELRKTHELLEAVTQGTKVMIAAVDRDLRYTFFNREHHEELKRLTGTDTAIGMGLADVLADLPAERERALSIWNRALAGETVVQTIPFGDPGRYRRWYTTRHTPIRDANGTVVGAGEVTSDTTELVLAERALTESRERFRILSETAGRLLATGDPQGLVADLCRGIMDHLGCEAFFNFLVDEEADRLRLNACAGVSDEDAKMLEWLDFGVAVCGCVARDGVRIVAEDIPNTPDPRTELVASYGIQAYCCHPLVAQGRLLGTLSFGSKTRPRFTEDEVEVMRTVADQVATAMQRVRNERELREAKRAAEEASRAKTDFLARMSHEIRTPMNGILGMTDLALMEPALSPRSREFLHLAKQSAKSLLDIINDVLDVAKIEAGRVELSEKSFPLASSIQDLLAPLRLSAQAKGLSFTERFSADLPGEVVGDEGRLRQVLTNLVSNAVKFTDQGGLEVSVEASREEASPDRTTLSFAVRDTGVGISPENLPAVFDSFSAATRSTHAKFGGTGLGLSIARQLVELMGGRIWVESPAPRPADPASGAERVSGESPGSVFHFTVEAGIGPQRAKQSAEEHPVAGNGGRRLRILVAEDNRLNRIYLEELLRLQGHDVVLATDGGEALDTLSRQKFDLVLMDVQMPYLCGDEAVRRIRAGLVDGCPRDLPVVALTAHAIQGDRERFLEAGMDDYLAKPFEAEDVVLLLERITARGS